MTCASPPPAIPKPGDDISFSYMYSSFDSFSRCQDLQEHYDKQHKKMEASDKSFLDVVRQEVEGSAAEE